MISTKPMGRATLLPRDSLSGPLLAAVVATVATTAGIAAEPTLAEDRPAAMAPPATPAWGSSAGSTVR